MLALHSSDRTVCGCRRSQVVCSEPAVRSLPSRGTHFPLTLNYVCICNKRFVTLFSPRSTLYRLIKFMHLPPRPRRYNRSCLLHQLLFQPLKPRICNSSRNLKSQCGNCAHFSPTASRALRTFRRLQNSRQTRRSLSVLLNSSTNWMVHLR